MKNLYTCAVCDMSLSDANQACTNCGMRPYDGHPRRDETPLRCVELARITIVRYLDPDGGDVWRVDYSDGVAFIDGLGMLEAAKMDLQRSCYPVVAADE